MSDYPEFIKSIQGAVQFLIAGLAYPVADGNALAFTRFLAVFALLMALRASGYRHWTLRAGLGILMFFLAMDAALGLAPGRVQVLTVAILGRNVAIWCICFGLVFFPSTRAAARRRRDEAREPTQVRQGALVNKFEKGDL